MWFTLATLAEQADAAEVTVAGRLKALSTKLGAGRITRHLAMTGQVCYSLES
jgi:hypothetical protein